MTRRRLGTVYAGGLPSNINSVSPPEQLAMMPRVWDLSSAEIFDHRAPATTSVVATPETPHRHQPEMPPPIAEGKSLSPT